MVKQNVYKLITGFHPYWGKIHTDIPEMLTVDVKKGDLVLAPFCGSGTLLLSALFRGGSVVAGDPDPSAVVLTRTLMQPVGLFALKQGFHQVADAVSRGIQERYTIACPDCRKRISFKELRWREGATDGFQPDAAKAVCNLCGWKGEIKLTAGQVGRQLKLARTEPVHWFPQNRIPGMGDNGSCSVNDLYSQRNLASLADLHHAIMSLSKGAVRDALVSVFLSVALRCVGPVSAGMKKLVKKTVEVNVWQVFEQQFQLMVRIRKALNAELSSIRMADTMDELEDTDNVFYIKQADGSSFLMPAKRKITHVFIELPIIPSDKDLLGAGLQAAWLKATGTPGQLESRIGRHGELNWKQQVTACLKRVIQNTDSGCRITVILYTATRAAEEALENIVCATGCFLTEIRPIPVSFEHGLRNRKPEKYFRIARQGRPARTGPADSPTENKADELLLYMRAAAFCAKTKEGKTVADRLFALLRDNLKLHYNDLKGQERKAVTADFSFNRKSFYRLCLHFLSIILAQDQYRIVAGRREAFDQAEAGLFPDLKEIEAVSGSLNTCDMVARNDAGKQIFFCFYEPEKENALKKFSARVFRQDGQCFDQLCYLIFSDRTEMDRCRQVGWADNWPRGFFICVSDLAQQAFRLRPDLFGEPGKQPTASRKQAVKHFTAEVVRNSPVGRDKNPMHYKLQFRTGDMRNIGPGQFVMVDPLPVDERKQMDRFGYRNIAGAGKAGKGPDQAPRPYLKRPFGVQRAYYKYFEWGYHSQLFLPPQLAGITHTVFPHKFEMLYKVIEGGIGTSQMTGLQNGDRLRILGPLGKYTHLPGWRFQGIEEVHLVGGGVGMAPLVFFGQALKFYSFRVKAFIGIDRMASLAESRYGKTFSEETGKAYVYIEELSRIGLTPGDIFLSREYTDQEEQSGKIAANNYYQGLVTEQYRSVLEKMKSRKNVLIITCGPKPMMVALRKIAAEFSLPMKVLLEKRMGCGIGVCMSCVCRTQKNDTKQYSRVCIDGPIFDAEDIDWETL